ncbi:MAG: hypothetical protein FD173_2032 [Gallionellaceae bacterium]|nr:MAG: hypothetical protein FD173_2032 [Gallionellaceae bacterium]
MKKQLLIFFILAFSGTSWTMAAEELSAGQALYLPIYSKIWHGDRVVNGQHPIDSLVSALVSIRNTSLKTPIRVVSARYYSTEGKLLKEYLTKPALINAMGTLELFVERKEAEGGSGANFVIQWDSAAPTNPPIIEAIHADIRSGQQALIFTTTARPIQADK